MRSLGRPRRRWEDNIKMEILEVGLEHRLNRSVSGQGQVAGFCKRDEKFSGTIKCGEFLE
jgi:hypothetical protein